MTIWRPMISVQNLQSDLLKYDVTDAYLGNLRHTIIIENPTNLSVTDVDLIVPLIKNETARHYVLSADISSSIGEPAIKSDPSENEYAQWSHLTIAPRENLTVRIDYLELSFSTQYQINRSSVAPYDTSSDLYLKFTKPEPLIESDNPGIINEARNLTAGLSKPSDIASSIYNYVVRHLHYVEQKEERGALWALNSSIGDCSEYSYLFVALCRAAGIPARVNAGFAFYPSGLTVQDGHMWAEYYLENYSWIPLDATWQTFNSMDYRHFDQVCETSENVPYANYMYSSVDEDKLEDQQTAILQAANVQNAPFAEGVLNSILQVKKTNLAVSIINPVGSLLFPQETAQANALATSSRRLLQDGIETLDSGTLENSLDQASKASQIAWTVLVRILAIALTVIIFTLSIILVFERDAFKDEVFRLRNAGSIHRGGSGLAESLLHSGCYSNTRLKQKPYTE